MSVLVLADVDEAVRVGEAPFVLYSLEQKLRLLRRGGVQGVREEGPSYEMVAHGEGVPFARPLLRSRSERG